jgi:hypothetical protein
MKTFRKCLQESVEYPTFSEIAKQYNGKKHTHHIKKVCVKCGNVETCRCMAPKTTVEGVCYYCTGERERPKPLTFI